MEHFSAPLSIHSFIAYNCFMKPLLLKNIVAISGKYGNEALLETLKVIEAKNIENLQLLIPFVKTKINAEGKLANLQNSYC